MPVPHIPITPYFGRYPVYAVTERHGATGLNVRVIRDA
jgi:hypothetical protein